MYRSRAGEIILRAEHTKDRENRIVPISNRLRRVLEGRRNGPAGVPFPSSSYVFGNEIGQRVGSVRRAWQTTVLRAHGHKPVWIWKKKTGPNDKGSTKLSPESEAAYRAINLHFHDLRHEGGSRLIEAGWPVHYVQHMLGHASLQQTSIYLTQRSAACTNRCGISIDPAPLAIRLQASPPAASGLFASRLPPEARSPSFTDCCSWRGRRDSNPRPPA